MPRVVGDARANQEVLPASEEQTVRRRDHTVGRGLGRAAPPRCGSRGRAAPVQRQGDPGKGTQGSTKVWAPSSWGRCRGLPVTTVWSNLALCLAWLFLHSHGCWHMTLGTSSQVCLLSHQQLEISHGGTFTPGKLSNYRSRLLPARKWLLKQ